MYDIIVLTQKEYIDPPNPDWYVKQILTEDEYDLNALRKKGLNVYRTNWDNPDFNRYETKLILFRTIWDYFHRFGEFSAWLNDVKNKAILINPAETVYWNIDKHYLKDLEKKGIPIPPTEFAEIGDTRNLYEFFEDCAWKEAVLKPAVSGAGRHTYKINRKNLQNYNAVFKELVKTEAMMLQEYQKNITVFGETACMVFNGKFSHAVLKKAKTGEFRVQDDFGGSVYHYTASREEIELAEKVTSLIQPVPVYSRVDMIKDNLGNWAVGELELIEPELWFRFYPPAADLLADALCRVVSA